MNTPLKPTSFGHIRSGLDALDRVLDNIRLGDNVVWQVDDIADYPRQYRRSNRWLRQSE